MKLKSIKDQVVVIFGASSGIGRATALKMASKGAKVAVVARSKTGIDSLVTEIKNSGGDAFGIIADCTEIKQVRHVADSTIKRWGRIDTWVQCAGITVFASFEDTTEEEYVQIIDVNLLGCVRAARVALPLLKKQGGALIFVNSVEGQRGLQFQSAYASSKHAVKGLTDSLRIELKMENSPVSVTNIYPSNIDTPLYDNCRVKVDNGEFKYTGVTPPTYSTDRTADSIIYAATHPVRDLVVGTGGWFLCQLNKVAPSIVDLILAKWGKCAEKSKMTKVNEDNMFKPLDKYNTTTGLWEKGTGPRVLPFSVYNAIREHPIFVKAAALALGAVGAALTAVMTIPLKGEPLRIYEVVRP